MKMREELLFLCRRLNLTILLTEEMTRLVFVDEYLEKNYPKIANDLRARWNSLRYEDAGIGKNGQAVKVGEEVE